MQILFNEGNAVEDTKIISERLYKAVKDRNLSTARDLSHTYGPQNFEKNLLNRALFHAAANPKTGVEFVEILQRLGANLDVVVDGRTPSHVAALLGNGAVMDCLYDLGAKFEEKAEVGMTPPELFVSPGVINRAAQNVIENPSRSRFWWMVGECGRTFEARLRMLVSQTSYKDKLGVPLLHQCLFMIDEYNLLEFLSDIKNDEGFTLLYFIRREIKNFEPYKNIAAHIAKLEAEPLVASSLKRGAVELTLHSAVMSEVSKVVELVLDSDGDIHAKNNNGQMPRDLPCTKEIWDLLFAAELKLLDGIQEDLAKLNECHPEAIRIFLQRGHKIDRKILREYPNILAASVNLEISFIQVMNKEKGALDKFKPRMEKEVSIDTVDEQGRTLLFFAKNPAVIEFMIEYGFSPNAQTRCEVTPLMHACASDSYSLECIEVLLGRDDSMMFDGSDTPLHAVASRKDPVAIVNFLVNKKMDINAEGKSGFTPLHCAVRELNFPMVKALVEAGANVLAENDYIINLMPELVCKPLGMLADKQGPVVEEIRQYLTEKEDAARTRNRKMDSPRAALVLTRTSPVLAPKSTVSDPTSTLRHSPAK